MSKRHPNPKMAKIHRSYTVDEVAKLYCIHRNTVRQWIKAGLPVCDSKRPLLILGTALRAFLEAKRQRNKSTCEVDEIYCVRCRIPQKPALGMVDYKPVSKVLGSLIGMCPACDSLIYRRVNATKLAIVQSKLTVTLLEA